MRQPTLNTCLRRKRKYSDEILMRVPKILTMSSADKNKSADIRKMRTPENNGWVSGSALTPEFLSSPTLANRTPVTNITSPKLPLSCSLKALLAFVVFRILWPRAWRDGSQNYECLLYKHEGLNLDPPSMGV